MTTVKSYTRRPCAKRNPIPPEEARIAQIIHALFFGKAPHSLIRAIRKEFNERISIPKLGDLVKTISEQYPDGAGVNIAAFIYTNISNTELAYYSEIEGGYIWNTALWRKVVTKIKEVYTQITTL